MTAEFESETFGILVRWVKRFAILGAACGVFLMFSKETLIAESGRKPADVLWYWIWIPVMAVFGSIAGAGIGFIVVLGTKLREWAGLV